LNYLYVLDSINNLNPPFLVTLYSRLVKLNFIKTNDINRKKHYNYNRQVSTAMGIWNLKDSNKPYSIKRVYEILSSSEPAPKPMLWIWKSCCLPKIKIFFLGFYCKIGLIPVIFLQEKNSTFPLIIVHFVRMPMLKTSSIYSLPVTLAKGSGGIRIWSGILSSLFLI
jgi:hypothetical protein